MHMYTSCLYFRPMGIQPERLGESTVQEPWKPLVFKMPQKKQADGDGFAEVGPEKCTNLLQGKIMILGELSIV